MMRAKMTLRHVTNVQTDAELVSLCDNVSEIRIPAGQIPAHTVVDILPDPMQADTGDDGYFVVPDSFRLSSQLTRFIARDDGEAIYVKPLMPFFGIVRRGRAVLAIVTGMPLAMDLVLSLKNARYTLKARFCFADAAPDEDIRIRLIELYDDDANYSGIARCYRRYQLQAGHCRPLRERAGDQPLLDYAAHSFSVRIRHGWKPRPASVLHQTPENEPPMYTAIDFDRTVKLMDEFHARGIDKAEFCLVGWNKSGHDGRFPQHFPVEAALGGEGGLKRVLLRGKDFGYPVDLFTNSTGAYEVADCFSPDLIAKEIDGSLMVGGVTGSGYCYKVCPSQALRYSDAVLLPRLGREGWRGLHYIDVQSIVPPAECHDENHPLTRKEWVGEVRKIARLSRECIGGYSSEGGYDCYSDVLDYALYVCFDLTGPRKFCDERVPLWQLVYHGIIMSNPSAETVNYPVKGWRERLLAVEYGARPVMYYYSRFCAAGQNWMGEQDLVCDSDEAMKESVDVIGRAYAEYRQMADLQFEFMEEHRILTDTLHFVRYSDGTVILLNYGCEDTVYDENVIPARDYVIIRRRGNDSRNRSADEESSADP